MKTITTIAILLFTVTCFAGDGRIFTLEELDGPPSNWAIADVATADMYIAKELTREQLDDIIWALETAIKHIDTYEPVVTLNAVYIDTPGMLRQQADEIEQRRRDVKRIKQILNDLR